MLFCVQIREILQRLHKILFLGVWPPVYGLEIDLRLREEFIYFATVMKPAVRSTQPSIQYYCARLSWGKGTGHTLRSSAKIQKCVKLQQTAQLTLPVHLTPFQMQK